MNPNWKPIVGKGFTLSDFQAYVASLILTDWKPQFVVLHNTADPTFAEWHKVNGNSRMNGFQNYYGNTMGWSAGPHLFVADDLIWVFTPLTTSGVHSPSWNVISWGVETVGDYSTELLSDAVRTNLLGALTALHKLGGLDPGTLRLHFEDPATTHKCPGVNLASQKASLISEIQASLGVC